MNIKELIEKRVHDYYWKDDINCAMCTLKVLAEIFSVDLNPQILDAAIGMNGAGKYRAQCGLVEGTLMLIGVLGKKKNIPYDDIKHLCYQFAERFEKEFGSLLCRDLRPDGFSPDNPPHLCEELTRKTILFSLNYIQEILSDSQQ
jgi:C_GCAxxG_C_C family probable redox protein